MSNEISRIVPIRQGAINPKELSERAQRIRDLVGVARICIIEIGRELAEARKIIHGEKAWEDWLLAEFLWSERTAYKYITVATAFNAAQPATIELTIEPTALYALSARGVPQEVREDAIASTVAFVCGSGAPTLPEGSEWD